ncbi:MAG: hypothetical protein IPM92_00950 [Saprospiraceae bacterium]|nr:hypothetical protein [Saprospiraceae bacterium]
MLDFYVSRDQQRFSPVENGRFKDVILNEFFSFPDNILVAISVFSNIYISGNGGETWEDFSNGLGLLQNDVKNIGDFTLDDASNAYASISYDGLYKSINPLVATREFKQDNDVNLYYDKSGEQLKWHCQICASDSFLEITLFDILGRVLKKSKINAGMTSISIPNEWTSAPYAYTIKGKGNFQAAGYFVKY